MTFDMYGDVILPRDDTVRGLRAGDVGTVVEARRAKCPRRRLLGRVLRHDGQYGHRSQAAGECPPHALVSRSSDRACNHGVNVTTVSVAPAVRQAGLGLLSKGISTSA